MCQIMVLKTPHLLYCDLSPHQNSAIKIGMQHNDAMNQHHPNYEA